MALRAKWTSKYEKALVDILMEYNVSHYRGQNGWCTEGWNKIVREFNKLFPEAKFTKSQIQDKETQLKKDFKAIKSIKSRSGFSWDHNASMIKTTPEKWEEVIEEDPKLKRYENKSFPLFESLDHLYEGQCAEGKHCFTSSNPSHGDLRGKGKTLANTTARKRSWDGCVSEEAQGTGWRSLEVTREQDEEEYTVHSVQRQEDIGRSFGNMARQSGDDDLSDEGEPDIEHQQERGEQAKARRDALGSHKRKSNKQGAPIPRVEETMSAFLDLKREQVRSQKQASKEGKEFSIACCFEVLHSMEDLSDDIKVMASDVFKDPLNREMFIRYEPRLRSLWLKKEVNKLGSLGTSMSSSHI